MPIKSKINEILEDKGIKKSKLAEYLKMSRQALDYHLKGDEEIDKEILGNIIEFLNKGFSIDNSQNISGGKFKGETNITHTNEPQSTYSDNNVDTSYISLLKEKIQTLQLENLKLKAQLKMFGDQIHGTKGNRKQSKGKP